MGNCCSEPQSQPPEYNGLNKPKSSTVVKYDAGSIKAGGICQVLFFPDNAMPCKFGDKCRRNNCVYAHQPTSLGKLLGFLSSARQTIEVCVFTITCNEIADTLLDAHKQGVRVRIISDDEQMASVGSDIQTLKKAGIPVKVDSSNYHMHHKFCVIDKRLLLNGSFNWTRQAVIGNNENVVIQDTPYLVTTFSSYFEGLWNQFKSI